MQIVNPLKSAALDVTVLTDPVTIQAYKDDVANQMLDQRGSDWHPIDLSDRISDIRIETAAQGSSLLEVHIIDPAWTLLVSGFITVDSDGFLYPPIEINFPKGNSDSYWRLCQCRPSTDLTDANLILTFEDRIASAMREVDAQTGGISQAAPNETLAGFLGRLVAAAAKKTGIPIRFVALVAPSDPNYSAPIGIPSSAKQPASNARANPNKDPGGLTATQQAQLNTYQSTVSKLFGGGGIVGIASGAISEVEVQIPDALAGIGNEVTTGGGGPVAGFATGP